MKFAINNKSKFVKRLILIISIIFVLFLSTIIIRFIRAPKIAEDALAIKFSDSYTRFLSFDEVYSTVELHGLEYEVKLSGSANISESSSSKKCQFHATVYINCITGSTSISLKDRHLGR